MSRLRVLLLFSTILQLLGCGLDPRWEKQKEVPFDLGQASIRLPKDFHFRPESTDREPESIRFHFYRVNDTHFNGQTSYAEGLTLAYLNPQLPEEKLRTLVSKAAFDPLGTRTIERTEKEGPLEWQIGQRQYEQHPVSEPAHVVRLIDTQRHIVLGWYGYQKHYTVEQAKANLKRALASLQFAPQLASRFADYEKWKGNDWMGAYFDNKDRVIAALASVQLDIPTQSYIGALSYWESKDDSFAAIDGERPAHLHFVRQLGAITVPDGPLQLVQPVVAYRFEAGAWKQYLGKDATSISPDLQPSFTTLLKDKSKVYFFRVYRFNIWQKLPAEENPILTWLQESLADAQRFTELFRKEGVLSADSEP